ncbi:MAG: carbon storage regulator [Pirellulaceae bacterium]
MLVLSRKVGQELVIGDNIRIVINRVSGNRVAIGIDAPENVSVLRSELRSLRDQFEDEECTVLSMPAPEDSSRKAPAPVRCAR